MLNICFVVCCWLVPYTAGLQPAISTPTFPRVGDPRLVHIRPLAWGAIPQFALSPCVGDPRLVHIRPLAWGAIPQFALSPCVGDPRLVHIRPLAWDAIPQFALSPCVGDPRLVHIRPLAGETNDSPATLTFRDLAQHPPSPNTRIRIRGFLYTTSEGILILSAEPNLKTCCLGAPSKKMTQLVIQGKDLSQESRCTAVTVEGTFNEPHQLLDAVIVQASDKS